MFDISNTIAYQGLMVFGTRAREPFPGQDGWCDVRSAGAEFVDGAAVIDGQMVSARAWPDHPAWMREFMTILRSKVPA
jgi:putative intracellular protease/amidase